uniref:Uncharacterized protein n=1 Tax=Opuntia streptacantha TaxID=393608 RepID=A0A7C9DCQ4_OPUST
MKTQIKLDSTKTRKNTNNNQLRKTPNMIQQIQDTRKKLKTLHSTFDSPLLASVVIVLEEGDFPMIAFFALTREFFIFESILFDCFEAGFATTSSRGFSSTFSSDSLVAFFSLVSSLACPFFSTSIGAEDVSSFFSSG